MAEQSVSPYRQPAACWCPVNTDVVVRSEDVKEELTDSSSMYALYYKTIQKENL